ncbi:MAG: hypothetical protein M1812_007623 [Candelaria pacifica]|nr:MAG: hypothetical protein M1812_007623 [Candelaria pacifica]
MSALETELSHMRHFLHGTPTPKYCSDSTKSSSIDYRASTIRKPLSPNALINSYTHDLTSPLPSICPLPLKFTTAQQAIQQHYHNPPWPPRSSSLPPHLRNPPQPHRPNPLPTSQQILPDHPPPAQSHPPSLQPPPSLSLGFQGLGITIPHPFLKSQPSTYHANRAQNPLLHSLHHKPTPTVPSSPELIARYAATGFRGTLISRLEDGSKREIEIMPPKKAFGEGRSGFREGVRREIQITTSENYVEPLRGEILELK